MILLNSTGSLETGMFYFIKINNEFTFHMVSLSMKHPAAVVSDKINEKTELNVKFLKSLQIKNG